MSVTRAGSAPPAALKPSGPAAVAGEFTVKPLEEYARRRGGFDFARELSSPDSTLSVAIGNAEETRTVDGGKTRAYGGHEDPGNAAHNTGNPTLRKLATGSLTGQGDYTCVASTLVNMERLGVPQPAATGLDTGNNPRGGMVQLVRDFGWKSLPLPGSRVETIHSPAYGTIQANVVSADAYEKLALAGQIPSGAIIFQTRHGSWNDDSEGSRGFDMGIVRDGGRETFNYQSNGPLIYGSAQSVVILVPGDALKQQ